MTSKAGWEKSTNGPDAVDVETMMRAMGGLHSGHVGVVFSPAGIGFSGGLDVSATMVFDVLPGSSLPAEVTVARGWPCTEHTTLFAHIFALLYELDAAIGKTYEQESLWK